MTASKECAVEGCTKKKFCRGWCTGHYSRWQRHGDPLAGGATRYTNVDFDELVDRTGGPDACWPWQGGINDHGYGRYRKWPDGKLYEQYAHREAWLRAEGSLPSVRGTGLVIDHRCHVPGECAKTDDCPHRRCCNPSHLKLVPQSENASWERSNSNRDGVRAGGDCTVCGYPAHHAGLCGAHYSRLQRHGDVQAHIPIRGR